MLSPRALSRLMPLHLLLSAEGTILSAGPTLRRLFPGQRIKGRPMLALFTLRAPRQAAGFADLVSRSEGLLALQPRLGPGAGLRMRGTLVPADGAGRWLANLSFGIDVLRAVNLLQLTDADFAVTELAKELLFTAEANVAVTAEMRAMSRRLERARAQAMEEAKTDPLTGLRNRRACDSFLARICSEGGAFALMHMDLDYFKQVNDQLGHAAGDHVLREVARILRREARANDCIARVGGDEFVLVLPDLTDTARLVALGERLIEGLSRPIAWADHPMRISASIGVARVAAGVAPQPAQVMATADSALYAAKEAGRGRVELAEDLGLGVMGGTGGRSPAVSPGAVAGGGRRAGS